MSTRMIKLFNQKSMRAFDEYLALNRKPIFPDSEEVRAKMMVIKKTESDIWLKAAELLKKEEMNK